MENENEEFVSIPAVPCKKIYHNCRGNLKDYKRGNRVGENFVRPSESKNNRFASVLLDCIFSIDGEDYVKTMPNGGDRISDIEKGIDNFREIQQSAPVISLGIKYSWIQLTPIDYPEYIEGVKYFVEIVYKYNGSTRSMGHRLTKKELNQIVEPMRRDKTLVAIKYKTPSQKQIEILGL